MRVGGGEGGEGTEQTPGLGLMRALFKEALSQAGLPLRRRQKGSGKEESEAVARFHAISCRATWGAAQVRCLECHLPPHCTHHICLNSA